MVQCVLYGWLMKYILVTDGDSSHTRDPGLCGPGGESHLDDEEREPPAVVVYLVEPFSLGSEMTDVQRLACLGLLRCFTAMLNAIPEHIRSNISVQVSHSRDCILY